MRRTLIAANWKMNLGRTDEALALVRRLRPTLAAALSVDVAICPPFTVIAALAEVLGNSRIGLGAQEMHWSDGGAHTGDVSPAMLEGLCDYVILGHSERRASRGASEADDAINRKVRAALEHSLAPIICVGESAAQRDAGQTHDFVGGQVATALAGVDPADAGSLVLAYEPIWAIGSGQAATPVEANRTRKRERREYRWLHGHAGDRRCAGRRSQPVARFCRPGHGGRRLSGWTVRSHRDADR
jgi:triosephosphate isomerase